MKNFLAGIIGRSKPIDARSLRLKEYDEKLAKTEVIHQVLGPCRYMTGNQDIKDDENDELKFPYWCARPKGWNKCGFELIVSGTESGFNKEAENNAVEIYKRLIVITEQANKIYKDPIEPSWVNCINDPIKVIFINPKEHEYTEPPYYYVELDSEYNVVQVNREW